MNGCDAAMKALPLTCNRCGRITHPWPLRRPDACAPKHWVYCIRKPQGGK